jgi:3-oxoacyl-[acyl-carrier-protein] synthase-3
MGLRTSIRILGSGASLPATAVTREALDARLGLLPGTLADYGAARQRYLATDETAAGLAARACEQALAASGLAWQDIDCLVAANATMDQGLPYNASLIHAELGLQRHPIASFDVGASCLSFLNALDIVGHLLHNGRYRNVMLVSADIATFGLNWKELRECGNFGDGAAAVVLRRSAPGEASCIRTSSFRTLSQGVHFCEIPAGGSRFHPERIRQPFEPLTKFSMDGKAVFKLVAGAMEGFIADVLEASERTLADIAAVVPHQASRLAIDHLRRRLDVPQDKVVDVFDEFANQVGASLPSALHRAIASARIRRGDDVLLIGSGAGVSLGGMVLTY